MAAQQPFTTLPGFHPQRKRDFIHFLSCVGLAVIFWFFHALSMEHEATISVNLKYNLAENKTTKIKLPSQAQLRVRASGWELLREKFFNKDILLDLKEYANDYFLVTNRNSALFSQEQ